MKKSYYILITACVILLGLGLVKLYQRNTSVSNSVTDQILMENADRIKRALALCEMDDDQEAFIQKAFDILMEHNAWGLTKQNILKENPELAQKLAQKIDEQWMDAIYRLGLSLKDESNQLRQGKKAAAIEIIASQLTKENQKVLEEYLRNRMQQDGIVIA